MGWNREKLPTLESHVYNENGAEIMVYNMKRHPKKKRTRDKKRRKREVEEDNKKKEKRKTIDHATRA